MKLSNTKLWKYPIWQKKSVLKIQVFQYLNGRILDDVDI